MVSPEARRKRMIVKKLREKRGWSQAHLAEVSGLSTRTVQRIEGGNKASLESLMSLASALEVEISTLKQEIIVIDKTTEKWRNVPFYVRVMFADSNLPVIGPKNRKNYLRFEAIIAASSILLFLLGFIESKLQYFGMVTIFIAYLTAVAIRQGDKYDIW